MFEKDPRVDVVEPVWRAYPVHARKPRHTGRATGNATAAPRPTVQELSLSAGAQSRTSRRLTYSTWPLGGRASSLQGNRTIRGRPNCMLEAAVSLDAEECHAGRARTHNSRVALTGRGTSGADAAWGAVLADSGAASTARRRLPRSRLVLPRSRLVPLVGIGTGTGSVVRLEAGTPAVHSSIRE